MAQKQQTVTVDGHRITLTNLDKVLYPETGTTKGDVLSYYAAIAEFLIPHAANRPVTRKRWVNGVGTPEKPGAVFFQKNLEDSAPSWVKRGTIEHKDHVNEYPMVNDLATLTWLGQIAALEIHVPQWQFARGGGAKNPDRLVLDLDPGEGMGLADCVEVAKLARSILSDMGLDPMPVTSGSKGIHLYAALDGSQSSDRISEVAHELARALEADHPDLVVSDMKKSLRRGKILVDWSQNNAAKTTVAPYSLRGRFRPTVAAPRTWKELDSADLEHLDYLQVLKRMKHRADPLAALSAGHAEDPPGESGGADRLGKYRSMRDASKTPEPVPEGKPAASAGNSFVIQEHHASRLHWDFRLEHDGVLVSWALPKGPPTEPKQNHLAVQTEDHPLEYGSFQGSIPKGEYGAGDVTIWDAGEYELEKWRDGKEVIATLHGRPGGGLGGPRKYALIHTGDDGRAENTWLIHLMKDSPGVDSATEAPTTKAATRSKAPSGSAKTTRDKTAAGKRAAFIAPMLATLGTESSLDGDEDWAFEMKWDGIRAIVAVDGADTRLYSRNENDVTVSYPDVAERMTENLDGRSAVLDGEIVAINRKGRPDFGLLQSRMKLTRKADVEKAVGRTPVQLLLFDILQLDGESLTALPYDERRRMLEDVVRSAGPIQVPPAFEGDVDEAMSSSLKLGLEGVMAKKRGSTYAKGRRSAAWIKIKHHLTQEVVVGGWRPGKGRRSGTIGSLLLGIPDAHGLHYVGRVGTGFGDRQLEELEVTLGKLARKTSPFTDVPRAEAADARWVSPSRVGEVAFAEWTAGGHLRQPSWRGWRPDTSPADVVPES
ncbi:ATP-dependent DNA ligase [Parafrigoribacterium soli]|uniref:ATP-dependent DNA ligase n=1 Tax=Parafrigoribacterium soli TaxID=3144663 RepID=UPI0032EE4843